MAIQNLLNTTLAGQIAQMLDAKDSDTNEKDNKISASVWNAFVADKGGKRINDNIDVNSAMNSITTYLIRQAKQLGVSANDLAKEWLGQKTTQTPTPTQTTTQTSIQTQKTEAKAEADNTTVQATTSTVETNDNVVPKDNTQTDVSQVTDTTAVKDGDNTTSVGDANTTAIHNDVFKDENSEYKGKTDKEIVTTILTKNCKLNIEDEDDENLFNEILNKYTNRMDFATENKVKYTDIDIRSYVRNLYQAFNYKTTLSSMYAYTAVVAEDCSNKDNELEQQLVYENPYIQKAIENNNETQYGNTVRNFASGIINAADEDNDQKISFEEFCKWQQDIQEDDPIDKEQLRKVYDQCYDTDGNGNIDLLELAGMTLTEFQQATDSKNRTAKSSYNLDYDEYNNTQSLMLTEEGRETLRYSSIQAQQYLTSQQNPKQKTDN